MDNFNTFLNLRSISLSLYIYIGNQLSHELYDIDSNIGIIKKLFGSTSEFTSQCVFQTY